MRRVTIITGAAFVVTLALVLVGHGSIIVATLLGLAFVGSILNEAMLKRRQMRA